MPTICRPLLALAFCCLPLCFFAQTVDFEPEWFQRRIAWRDRFDDLIPCTQRLAIVVKNGLFGIVDSAGRALVPPTYTQRSTGAGSGILTDGYRRAEVDPAGKIVKTNGRSQRFRTWDNRFWQTVRKNRFGLTDAAGRVLLPPIYSQIRPARGYIVVVDTLGRWGVIDPLSRWIIQPEFTYIEVVGDGFFQCQKTGQRSALFDRAGIRRTDYRFRYIQLLCDGTFWAQADSSFFQHFDGSGQLIPDSIYQHIQAIGEDRIFKVDRPGRTEYWDSCGQVILGQVDWVDFNTDHDAASSDHVPSNILLFKENGLFGAWINATHRKIPAEYRQFFFPPNQIIGRRTEGTTDWFDRQGTFLRHSGDSIVSALRRYGEYFYASRRFWVVQREGREGLIDSSGRLLLPCQYHNLIETGSGCLQGSDDKRRLLILGPAGQVIPVPAGCQPDRVYGNYLLFKKERMYGLADLGGRVLIPPTLQELSPMADNYHFFFREKDRYGVVDAHGRVVLPAEYDQDAIRLQEGHFFLEKDKKYGIATLHGKILVPFAFTRRQDFGYRVFLSNDTAAYRFEHRTGTLQPQGWLFGEQILQFITARRKGRWGLLDRDLEPVFPFQYDTIFQRENHLVLYSQGKEHWFRFENGGWKYREVGQVLGEWYWATLVEKNGKQGLLYADGDSLPYGYDQILPDHKNRRPLALLQGGQCTVPGDKNQPPKFEFSADSIRSTVVDTWLQYWYGGEAWVLNTANGARRRIEMLEPPRQYEWFDWDGRYPGKETIQVYKIRTDGEERDAILDSLLQDRAPDSLRFRTENFIYGPAGEAYLRTTREGREGLWSVRGRRLVFPYEYDEITQMQDYSGHRIFVGGHGSGIGWSREIRFPSAVLLRQGNKLGLGRLSDGAVLLPCVYRRIDEAVDEYGLIHFADSTGHGVIRPADGKMLPPVYASGLYVEEPDSLILLQRENTGVGMANANLDIVIPMEYRELSRQRNWIIAQKDSLFGAFDRHGNMVLPPVYQRIDRTYYNSGFVARLKDKEAMLDAQLQPLTAYAYDDIQTDAYDPNWVKCWRQRPNQGDEDNYLTGLLDTAGREALPVAFADISFCANGVIVRDSGSGLSGMLRPDLSAWLPLEYERIQCFNDSHLVVRKNGRYGLLDPEGRVVLPLEYDNIEYGNGPDLPSVVGQNGRYALFAQTGQWRTGFDFDYAEGFEEGRAAARLDGRWGYLDVNGQWAIPPRYGYADRFDSQGRAWVWQDSGLVQIDTSGKVIPYTGGYVLRRRLFGYGCQERWPGLQDQFGRTVLSSDSLSFFEPNGSVCLYQRVQPDDGPRWGLADLTGRMLCPRQFDEVFNSDFSRAVYMVVPARRQNRWGYIDSKGQMVIPFRFDKAGAFDKDGKAEVLENGKTFWIDKSGKCVKGCE